MFLGIDTSNYTTSIACFDGVEGINELTLSNAAYLSAWKGGWVELPLDEAAFDEEMAKRVESSRYEPQMVVPEPTDGEYKTRWSVQW